MATTKSTAAKQAAPKKSAAKKTAATKSAAKKTTAKKTTAKKTAATKTTAKQAPAKRTPATATSAAGAVRETVVSVARDADETVKQYSAVATDQLNELFELVRGIVDTSIGIPFVIQSRLADAPSAPGIDVAAVKSLLDDAKARLSATPSVDFDAVKSLLDDAKSFLDEAKGEGHARLAAVQGRFEPVATSVTKRFDEATGKFEAQMPSQLSELIESGRARLRTLVAA